jgi:hypothetical protein
MSAVILSFSFAFTLNFVLKLKNFVNLFWIAFRQDPARESIFQVLLRLTKIMVWQYKGLGDKNISIHNHFKFFHASLIPSRLLLAIWVLG